MKKQFLVMACLGTLCSVAQEPATLPFLDTRLSFEERVDDLLGRLTTEEKVAQMMHAAPAIPRLGITAYNWWNEILHGVARTEFPVTSFPQAIGMAATWDTASICRMADYSAEEGRAIHNKAIALGRTGESYLGLTYWTPNINIFRDPRWGRGQETYGEDPFLTAMLARSFVRGLQGDDPKYLKAAACAKHFAVHSGPEPTRHSDNVNPGNYDLWDTYLPAFRELVVNAKVAGLMCAYNAVDGQPCCANDMLMTEILRHRWKFTGYVVSDCWAVDDFFRYHKTHPDALSSAVDALVHGTDIECGNSVYTELLDAVKKGMIAESQLDISLGRLFMIRFRLGMFDPPSLVKWAQIPLTVLESPEHRAHALKMARQSIVLLKNENHLLPLSKKIKKIAVIGPNAGNRVSVLGNYNGVPSHITTVLEGIREKLGGGVEIIYEPATGFTDDSITVSGRRERSDPAAMIRRLRGVDLVIFVGGISPELEGEESPIAIPGFRGGDRTSILLPAVQTQLMKELQAAGKKLVFVMMTGSALAIPWEAEHLPAIVNAWYGGQAAGTAVADVLFGDYNPAGRLPVSFYRSDADLPPFDDYSMANRTYRYFKGEPLFPFGYGLSYSNFVYTKLVVPVSERAGKDVEITVSVSNRGNREGEEVAQLYVSLPAGNNPAPVRALKGFARISLAAGETKLLHFLLRPEDLSLTGEDGNMFQPGGRVLISVGGGQPSVKWRTTSNVLSSSLLIE